ncbi:unnamed protein product, partial [Musa acuminata subsp. burmannicoides]
MEVHIIAQWRLHLLKKTTSEFTITEYPRGCLCLWWSFAPRTPLEAMAGRAHEGTHALAGNQV